MAHILYDVKSDINGMGSQLTVQPMDLNKAEAVTSNHRPRLRFDSGVFDIFNLADECAAGTFDFSSCVFDGRLVKELRKFCKYGIV